MNREINHIPDEVMSLLQSHHWPGNIRELQNILERAVIASTGSVLHLSPDLLSGMFEDKTSDVVRTLADAERHYISEVLKQTRGVVGGRDGAAARLGVARTTLLYRMRKLGIHAV